MGFLEKLLISITTQLLAQLGSWLANMARKSKLHYDEQEEFRDQAGKVNKAAEAIQGAVKNHQKITREQAQALKDRNAALRGDGLRP